MNISKRLVKAHKIYFRDSGLLHSMHGISSLDELTGHIICGSSWEGFVIQQIIQFLPNYVSAYFYRTHHGAESDLVLVKGNKPIVSIEIKLNNAPTISKGFYQSIDDLKTNYNFVITPESDTYKNKNITICSLFNFIQKFLPKVTK
jgi:predicted AAA+ superfamily ATPase